MIVCCSSSSESISDSCKYIFEILLGFLWCKDAWRGNVTENWVTSSTASWNSSSFKKSCSSFASSSLAIPYSISLFKLFFWLVILLIFSALLSESVSCGVVSDFCGCCCCCNCLDVIFSSSIAFVLGLDWFWACAPTKVFLKIFFLHLLSYIYIFTSSSDSVSFGISFH